MILTKESTAWTHISNEIFLKLKDLELIGLYVCILVRENSGSPDITILQVMDIFKIDWEKAKSLINNLVLNEILLRKEIEDD